MKGLLIKEYCYIKRNYMLFCILAMTFALFCHTFGDVNLRIFTACLVNICLAVLPTGTLNQDQQYSWAAYSEGLPLSKSTIVGSKFVLCLISSAFGILINAVSLILRINFNDAPFSANEIYVPLGILAIGVMASSIGMVVYYRFGYNAGFCVTFGMVGFCVGIVMGWATIDGGGIDFSSISATPAIIFGILAVISFTVCWRLSLKTYKKIGVKF